MGAKEENLQERHLTAQEILDTLAQHREELRGWGVQSIGLFGSYRRGDAKPDSDMDFLVTLERSSFDDYMDLKFFLEDLFESKVDLVPEKDIKPRLRPYIMEDVVYAPYI